MLACRIYSLLMFLTCFKKKYFKEISYLRMYQINLIYVLSSCMSVCVSVTCHYCVEMAEHMIIQTMPYDNPVTVVYGCEISAKFKRSDP